MKKNLFTLLMLAIALSFANCSSDDNNNSDEKKITPTTKEALDELRSKSLEELKQKKTFDATAGINFTSAKGVIININGNSLYKKTGELVTGNVDLEYIEIFDRGSMIATNKPLMGYDSSDNLRPLVTGGEFYVNVTQNGEQLTIPYMPYRLTIPAELTGELDSNMILWNGTIDDNGDLTWDEFEFREGQKGEGGVFTDGESNSYNLLSNDFGWTNVDILASEEGEKTPLLVAVPEGYTNKNASVYVAYKGKPNMLAFLDVYSPEKKLFSEHYGWAPIGFNLYVIFTSEHEGKYLYAIKDVTIAKNTTITFTIDEMQTGTKDEVIAKINALN